LSWVAVAAGFNMMRAIASVIGALLIAPVAVSAQETLRSVLPAEAIQSVKKADLDRPLTSSGYGSSPTAFVVAYYFVDELSANGSLGPLHVGRFNHRTREWKTVVPEFEWLGGSVTSVELTPTHALLDLHGNPSAGAGLVFALDTLKLVADMWGSPLAVFPDRTVLFIPGVVHFAPVHQSGLKVRHLGTGADVDVFPQPTAVRPVTEFMRRIDSVYARWPKERLDALKSYAYGSGEDFDRDIERVVWTVDGQRLAFAVLYSAAQLEREELADLYTVVVCQRRNGTWWCDERELEEEMRATGVRLVPNNDGFYERDAFEPLLRRLLPPSGPSPNRPR